MSDNPVASTNPINFTWAEGRHCASCNVWIPTGVIHHCASTTSVPPTFIPLPTGSGSATTVTSNGVWFSQEDRDRMIRIEEKLDQLLAKPRVKAARAAALRY